jgi:hypothetical protein
VRLLAKSQFEVSNKDHEAGSGAFSKVLKDLDSQKYADFKRKYNVLQPYNANKLSPVALREPVYDIVLENI